MGRYILTCLMQAVLILAFIGSNAGCQAWSAGTLQSDQGLLAVIYGDGQYKIVDLQGHETDISRKLGIRDALASDAGWSPTGKYLAFVCRLKETAPWALCSVDTAAMTLQTLFLPGDGLIDKGFTWSADEESILYVWQRGIWQIEIKTGKQSRLSSLPEDTYSVEDWSPDGSTIAFIRTSARNSTDPWWKHRDLYVQNADGQSKLLFKDAGGDAVWSPDGKMVAFGRDSICWVVVENNQVNCTKDYSNELAWSPDSKSLAFVTSDGINVVDTDSRIAHNVLPHPQEGGIYDLTWSPDGKYLAYTRCCCMKPNSGCEIHIVTGDGTRSWQLTHNNVADELPVWRPKSP